MKLKVAQVTGLNTDQKAAQVTSVVLDDGAFLAVLELKSDDAFTKGRVALSGIEDFYLESEGEIGKKLAATFKEFEEKFSTGDFSVKDGSVPDWSLSLAAISGKVLYLIGKGQVEVNLKRGNGLLSLLSVGVSSQLISGFLAEGDKLMVSTKSFTAFLGTEVSKSLDLPVESFKEEVESKIGASPEGSEGLAAVVVDIAEEGMEITPLSPQNEDGLAAEQSNSQNELFSHEKGNWLKKIYLPLKIAAAQIFHLSKLLGTYFPRSGRGKLILAFALFLIVAAGAGLKYKSSREREKQVQFNSLVQQAKDDFTSAKNIAALNPAEAKNKLDAARQNLGKALALKPNDQEAGNFKNQIEQDAASILQTSSVSDFPVFLDLELVKKNFRAAQLSLSGSKLLILDPGIKTLVAIDLEKKSNQILAGSEQLGEATAASLNGELAFVYSKDKGILRIDITNSKLSTVAKNDVDFADIKDIYGFAGNVYLLDSGKNMIWKYLPTPSGYSDKREYLNKETKVDLSGVIKMQIESSIFALKSGGEILRFTKGDKDHFSYEGLDKGVKDPKSFFVSSDTENLYLLDSGNSRLLILTKTGAYKGQMTGDKFATATDLAVDEAGKKVYLLEGSKIYSVDLK